MSMWLENVYMVGTITIVGEHPSLVRLLWAKCLWTEFALGNVLVGYVPGFTSVIWGYHFACKIKMLYKWFFCGNLSSRIHIEGLFSEN